MARPFDQRFVDDVLARLAALPDDAAPRWGRMSKQDLLGHLLAVLEFALGEFRAEIPYQVGPLRRFLLKTLVLRLNAPMRRGVVFRDARGEVLPLPTRAGTLDDLRRALERTREADPPSAPPHPYFGPLTFSEWKRLHVKHFAHHLRQFGVPL